MASNAPDHHDRPDNASSHESLTAAHAANQPRATRTPLDEMHLTSAAAGSHISQNIEFLREIGKLSEQDRQVNDIRVSSDSILSAEETDLAGRDLEMSLHSTGQTMHLYGALCPNGEEIVRLLQMLRGSDEGLMFSVPQYSEDQMHVELTFGNESQTLLIRAKLGFLASGSE